MASGIRTQGTKFKIETGTSTFTAIKGITGLSGPNETTDMYDDTDFDSTAKEWGYGLDDGGEVKIDFKYDPTCTGQAALIAARAAKTIKNFEIEKSNGDKVTFAALVQSIGEDYPMNEKVKQTASLKISGAVTRTPKPA